VRQSWAHASQGVPVSQAAVRRDTDADGFRRVAYSFERKARPQRAGGVSHLHAVGFAAVAYLSDLDRLLSVGSSYEDTGVAYLVDVYDLSEVVLPTGHVVACDPFSIFPGTAAFEVTAPPGTYPMRAWVATVQGGDAEQQKRVVALQLVIANEPTERWEMALTEDQDLESLSGEQFYGHSVDGGTSTLADLVAAQALSAWEWDQIEDAFFPGSRPRLPRLLSAPKPASLPAPPPVPGARTVVVDKDTGANIVAVESGWGDGAYPSFVGYSRNGRVTCFATDFLVVPR
jgi:hypothetical protein